jgi:hypothetical protein
MVLAGYFLGGLIEEGSESGWRTRIEKVVIVVVFLHSAAIIEVLKHKFGRKNDGEPLSEPPAA